MPTKQSNSAFAQWLAQCKTLLMFWINKKIKIWIEGFDSACLEMNYVKEYFHRSFLLKINVKWKSLTGFFRVFTKLIGALNILVRIGCQISHSYFTKKYFFFSSPNILCIDVLCNILDITGLRITFFLFSALCNMLFFLWIIQ